jgi:hypothetical protein
MLIKDLKRRPGFSVTAAFNTIDCHGEQFITRDNIDDFFQKQGIKLI